MVLHASSQNQTAVRSNLTAVYFPPSLIQTVSAREPNLCVVRVLIEQAQNPYCWASHPVQVRPEPENTRRFTVKN